MYCVFLVDRQHFPKHTKHTTGGSQHPQYTFENVTSHYCYWRIAVRQILKTSTCTERNFSTESRRLAFV